MRLAIQCFGPDWLTDIEVIDRVDFIDATLLDPVSADVASRVGALESQNAGPRLTAVEAQLGTPNSIAFPTKSDAQSGTIPGTVTTVVLLGRGSAGDGCEGRFKRISGSAPAGSDSVVNGSQIWVRNAPAGEVAPLSLQAEEQSLAAMGYGQPTASRFSRHFPELSPMRLTPAALALLVLLDAGRAFALDPDAYTRGGAPYYNGLRLPPMDRGQSSGEAGPFTVTPPGADLPRKMSEWFGDRANVLAFSGEDLSARFAKACASLPASGGTIYIPGRRYTSSGRLVCDGKPTSVQGDGPGITAITFTSAAVGAAGLSLSPGDALRPITIDGLTLTAGVDQVNGNAAITLRYGSAHSNIFKGPRITNVEIAGFGNNTTYWGKGIDAYNIWGFDFHGLHIRGKNVGNATAFPSANMGAAISITGENGGGCSDGKISGVNAIFTRYLGYVSGDCEGLHWADNTAVAVDQGIVWPDAKGHPGFFVARNHINAFSKGISIAGAQQGVIADNLIYKWDNSSQNFAGIGLLTYTSGSTPYYALSNVVHHNTVVGYAGTPKVAGEAIGVDASGGDGNTIQGNIFIITDYPFDFGNISSTNVVADNTAVGTVSGWQKRLGLNTISRNNNPVQAGTDAWFIPLTGGGSVNVGTWFQRFFLAADGSPKTYTDFTNAEAGLQITIIGQNANSTIANNSRIRLKGGASFVTTQGSSLTLIFTGEYWQEIGRAQ